MIIRYFRSNQSVLVLTTPLIAILFWAVHFFGDEEAFQFSGYLFDKLNDNISLQPWVWRFFSMTLIAIQALLITAIIQRTEIYSKLSHVPLLLTIVLGSMISWKGSFDPAMAANIFILMAIRDMMKVYHQNSAIGLTFNTGFWIGMAVLFEPALVVLLVASVIGVLMLRAADWRELLMLVVGGFLPTFFLLVTCFIIDIPYEFPTHYFHPGLPNFSFTADPLLRALIIIGGLLSVTAIFYYLRSLRGTVIRIRKMRLVLFYFLLSLVIVYFFLQFTNSGYYPSQLLLLPLAFLLSYFYMHIASPFLPDAWFYGLVVIWGFFVYNLYFV